MGRSYCFFFRLADAVLSFLVHRWGQVPVKITFDPKSTGVDRSEFMVQLDLTTKMAGCSCILLDAAEAGNTWNQKH